MVPGRGCTVLPALDPPAGAGSSLPELGGAPTVRCPAMSNRRWAPPRLGRTDGPPAAVATDLRDVGIGAIVPSPRMSRSAATAAGSVPAPSCA
jgi:hypothetical protein